MKNAVLTGIAGALLLLFVAAGAAGAPSATVAAGDWTGFGRTNDNMRHSPLTLITKSNVANLGRVYNIDLHALDSDTRRGEQSYPLAVGGTIYETTNDAQVFAFNGATGKVIWHYKPSNSGLFKNFGIVANRGLAYCDGALFMLTLDMHLNKLNPANGALLGRVAIGRPGRTRYGRSRRSSRAGARRAASSAVEPSGRPSRSTPARTRSTSARARRRPSTSRRSAPAPTRAPTR